VEENHCNQESQTSNRGCALKRIRYSGFRSS